VLVPNLRLPASSPSPPYLVYLVGSAKNEAGQMIIDTENTDLLAAYEEIRQQRPTSNSGLEPAIFVDFAAGYYGSVVHAMNGRRRSLMRIIRRRRPDFCYNITALDNEHASTRDRHEGAGNDASSQPMRRLPKTGAQEETTCRTSNTS
jgi:hypothetical protein